VYSLRQKAAKKLVMTSCAKPKRPRNQLSTLQTRRKKAAKESGKDVKDMAERASKEWNELADDAKVRASRVADDAKKTASSVADSAKKHLDGKKS
jgi:gas vesicle protein